MTENEAKKMIIERIAVTRQKIIVAKAYILRYLSGKNTDLNTTNLLNEFLASLDANTPDLLVIDQLSDTDVPVKKVAESFSWRLAFGEAVLQLIHSSIVLDKGNSRNPVLNILGWTNRGTGSSWKFHDLSPFVPNIISLALSQKTTEYQPLSDCDLYMNEVGIPEINSDVETALREAVACFKHELYLAALVMLGKAMEGSWIELGISLADALAKSSKLDNVKIREIFSDNFVGIGKKISEVIKIYRNPQLPEQIRKQSEIKIQDLENASIWADAVRESRNSIHHGAIPYMSNNYEKIAVLLIGAVPHLRLIYDLKKCSDRWIISEN